jgi:membrane-associated phospholipid phosphatase
LVAAGALALAVHAVARAAVGAHWLTDVVGSYLLAAGMACSPPSPTSDGDSLSPHC